LCLVLARCHLLPGQTTMSLLQLLLFSKQCHLTSFIIMTSSDVVSIKVNEVYVWKSFTSSWYSFLFCINCDWSNAAFICASTSADFRLRFSLSASTNLEGSTGEDAPRDGGPLRFSSSVSHSSTYTPHTLQGTSRNLLCIIVTMIKMRETF